MYDLLLKGGELIDPSQNLQGRKDIGISNGKIAAVADDLHSNEAKRVIDVKGKIVTPGLIDIHTHVFDGLRANGISPDDAGVFSGVTTVCDCGSTGWANFDGYRKFVISQAKTNVFCFLNMSSTGLAVNPEIWSWRNIDTVSTLNTINRNRDIIKGLKIRITEDLVNNLGIEVINVSKKVAFEAGLPIIVHIGLDTTNEDLACKLDSFSREMICLLDKCDILTHVFTPKPGGVIKPKIGVVPELKDAKRRGVILDLGQARANWSCETFRMGLEEGIVPTTLSTDISAFSINGPVYNLLVTMSRFLCLGLNLHEIIAMTTINPARALGEEPRRGSLKVGMPADITVIENLDGEFTFADGVPGKTFIGKQLLVPWLTIKSGVEIQTQSRFENAKN